MIIKYDNKAIKYTNKWISVDSQPTPPGPTPVEYVQIGNLLWQTENTNLSVSSGMVTQDVSIDGRSYGSQSYYNITGVSQLSSQLTDGWRVPTYSDFQALITAVNNNASVLCATSPDWSGTNTSGFTGLPLGIYAYEQIRQLGSGTAFYGTDGYNFTLTTDYMLIGQNSDNTYYFSVRLCKDAT